MAKLKRPRLPKARTSPLLFYVIAVFATTAAISLISFYLFWNSPARELAKDIQEAKEEAVANPFLPGYENGEVDVADGVLRQTEVDKLLEQAADLAADLEPERDFALEDYPDLSEL
ncbi:hypothetical protein F4X86_00425 [Candidatus Saccharibacteria bacterium]|nr:hypothetical protein [Candidatus Saccharibacteria bacterium]